MRRLWIAVFAALIVGAASATAAFAQNGSNFGNTCDVSNVTDQDPIYEPEEGHGHLHIHFGVLDVVNADNADTIRDEARLSSCNRPENNSAYWIPRIFSNGQALSVYKGKGLGDNTIYYRAGKIDDHESIQPFPRRLEMIARDDGGPGKVRWACDGGPLRDTPPETCASKLLNVHVEFPQCYEGSLTSDASKQPEEVVEAVNGSCPQGYTPLPFVTFGGELRLA